MTLQCNITKSIHTNLLKLVENQYELGSAALCRNVIKFFDKAGHCNSDTCKTAIVIYSCDSLLLFLIIDYSF
jgi:hypothetical protein